LHLFLLDVIVVFGVSIILILEIGTKEVVTKAFIMPYAFVLVIVGVLEFDAASGNNFDFLYKRRDR